MPILVNNVEITDDELYQEMQFHRADSRQQAEQKAANALIIKQLLLQHAHQSGLVDAEKNNSPEDEEKAIDELLKQMVTIPTADDTVCAQYYQQNKQRFIDKKTGNTLPLESVKSLIADYLHTRSLRTGITQYIKLLIGEAHIVGIDFDPLET